MWTLALVVLSLAFSLALCLCAIAATDRADALKRAADLEAISSSRERTNERLRTRLDEMTAERDRTSNVALLAMENADKALSERDGLASLSAERGRTIATLTAERDAARADLGRIRSVFAESPYAS